nr:hypothetical protein BaRGS_032565 [Batillaria attramentaria]
MILEAGAKVDHINSVNRTAAQMAAFVGQHQCVAMFLKENRELALEAYKVAKVLDIIVEESMKSRETNDPRAVKCHYFATIVRLANKSLKTRRTRWMHF